MSHQSGSFPNTIKRWLKGGISPLPAEYKVVRPGGIVLKTDMIPVVSCVWHESGALDPTTLRAPGKRRQDMFYGISITKPFF